MKHPSHRPKDRADFISKMEGDHYRLAGAGAHTPEVLPICVAVSLIQVICSVVRAKYDKQVSPNGVLSAIMAACPEMLDEVGGIRPDEAIDKCNKANNQKGLLIPGSTVGEVYRIQMQPHIFTHLEFCQALTMAECREKLGCRALAVVVKPDQEPPLHAMVTSNVGHHSNGVVMSAYDLQCEEGAREHTITDNDFQVLIVCNVDACEQLRGATRTLEARKGFDKQFHADLNRSRRVTKTKSPAGCGLLGCGRAQMEDVPFDQELLASIRAAQDSCAEMRHKLQVLRENFKNEFEAEFPKELLETYHKQLTQAPLASMQSLRNGLASRLSEAKIGGQPLPTFADLLEQAGFVGVKIEGFGPRLVKVLEQSGFDEGLLQGFRLEDGDERKTCSTDLWRCLAVRCWS
jgi:hypothetical protein